MSTLWLRGRTIAGREANARTKTLATANVKRENVREGGKYTGAVGVWVRERVHNTRNRGTLWCL